MVSSAGTLRHGTGAAEADLADGGRGAARPVFDLPVGPGRDPRRAAARVTAAGLTYPVGELSLALLSLVLLEAALAPMAAGGAGASPLEVAAVALVLWATAHAACMLLLGERLVAWRRGVLRRVTGGRGAGGPLVPMRLYEDRLEWGRGRSAPYSEVSRALVCGDVLLVWVGPGRALAPSATAAADASSLGPGGREALARFLEGAVSLARRGPGGGRRIGAPSGRLVRRLWSWTLRALAVVLAALGVVMARQAAVGRGDAAQEALLAASLVAAGAAMAAMLRGKSLFHLRTRVPRSGLRVGRARAAGLLCDLWARMGEAGRPADGGTGGTGGGRDGGEP